VSTRIEKLKIRDFRGIASLDINAGEINLFAGQNAQGKTGVLDAIAAALRGKVPAEAVRHDAKRAEIFVELDNGTTIHRKIPASGKQTVVVKKDSATLSSPQGWLESLFSDEAMNPIEFIKAKDRQKKLLEALPVTTTPAECVELLESVGLGKADVAGLRTDSAHAFEVFGAVADKLKGDRKGVNAEVKQATAWIKQERADLEGIEDPSEKIEVLTTRLAEAKAAEGTRADRAARLENLQTKSAGLDEALAEARQRVTDLEKQAADVAAEIEGLEAAKPPETDAGENLADMEAELAELRETKGTWDESQRRLGQIDAKELALADLKERQVALNKGVKLFTKEAPAMALARTPLPVEGLEYKDGAFYVNGTHLDQLSGAETTRVAVQFTLERVRQKGLHVVCVDGLEALDNAQREQFFSEMAESGVQLWATEVDHGHQGRGAPEGDGVLYVVMKSGAPESTQATIHEQADQPAEQSGLTF